MKPGLHQLAQSGATDGQIATWDADTGLWVPADLPAQPEFLVTVVAGVPSLVFDTDGQVVYTEGV